MTRSRAIVALLALLLALPSSALAQGAGDQQYQDPFGGEQTQDGGGGGGGDDGLSDDPPVGGGGGGGDTGGGGETDPPAEDQPAAEAPKALPNTGSDPRVLAFLGLVLLMFGVGLRLRTIDPDSY